MSQPTPYSPSTNFSAELGTDLGNDLDDEFNNLEVTTRETRQNLALVQRDDGALQNEIVTPESLSAATLVLIAGGWTPRGAWVTGADYTANDVVGFDNDAYVAVTDHTAGADFAVDLADDKWLKIVANAVVQASAVVVQASGSLASINAQDALEELSTEITGHISDTVDAHDASAISYAGASGISATDVEGAIDELASEKANLAGAVFTGLVIMPQLNYGEAGGTVDVITATITGIAALTDGLKVQLKIAGSNTSVTPTLNINSLGAKTIYRRGGLSVRPADLRANQFADLYYSTDLNGWILDNPMGMQSVFGKDMTTVEVVSSNTKTDLYSVSIPANALGTRGSLRWKLFGDYLNNSGGAVTLTVTVEYGATTIFSRAFTAIATDADRRAFTMEGELAAHDATNSQSAVGQALLGAATANSNSGVADVAPTIALATHTSVAEDSTAAKTFKITVQHSASNANLSFRKYAAELEFLP
jgi:hypothetical protein